VFQAYYKAFELQQKLFSEELFNKWLWYHSWSYAEQQIKTAIPDINIEKLREDKQRFFLTLPLNYNLSLLKLLDSLFRKDYFIVLITSGSKEATAYKIEKIQQESGCPIKYDKLYTEVDKIDIKFWQLLKKTWFSPFWLFDDNKEICNLVQKIDINAIHYNFEK